MHHVEGEEVDVEEGPDTSPTGLDSKALTSKRKGVGIGGIAVIDVKRRGILLEIAHIRRHLEKW